VAFETILKKMPDSPVSSPVILNIHQIYSFHRFPKHTAVIKGHDKMKVIRHEDEVMDFKTILPFIICQNGQKGKIVLRGTENRHPVVPSADNVIGTVVNCKTSLPRHKMAPFLLLNNRMPQKVRDFDDFF
jgi:hypothetical protein